MKDIIQILNESSICFSMREDLKALAQNWLALREEEIEAISEMHRSKAGINERQYAKRMSEPMSQEKRDEVMLVQYSWRALFANSVLRAHEARLSLFSIVGGIEACLNKLGPQKEASAVRAVVALTQLLNETRYKSADSVLAELDNVRDLSRDRIFEAVKAIFVAKKYRKGHFAGKNFTARMLHLKAPGWWQKELAEAVKPAIAIRKEMEDLWTEFTTARSKMNIPQFTQRMEAAWAAGETEKAEQVREERKNAEARLFISASRYAAAFPRVGEADEILQYAFQKAADFIDENILTVENVKAMTHALGAWHWLGELRIYIGPKFRAYNVQAILDELAFDADSYTKG